MAAGLAWATLSERVAFAIYADETRSYARDHVAILDWLERAMPPGAALAVHDIGLPAFRLDRKLVDLVGLRGPDAAAIHRAVTAREGPDSRGRALAAILARSGATHVLLLDGWDEFETFGRSLREAGVALDPVRVEGRYRAYAVRAAPR
jgi:hypothetical protein